MLTGCMSLNLSQKAMVSTVTVEVAQTYKCYTHSHASTHTLTHMMHDISTQAYVDIQNRSPHAVGPCQWSHTMYMCSTKACSDQETTRHVATPTNNHAMHARQNNLLCACVHACIATISTNPANFEDCKSRGAYHGKSTVLDLLLCVCG